MRLTAYTSDITVSEPVVLLNSDDCLKMGVSMDDRVRITGKDSAISTVVISDSVIKKGVVAIPINVMKRCSAENGSEVEVEYYPMPESVRSIKKKINGMKLSRGEIDSIVQDIDEGNLSEKEIIAFVSSFNVNNADLTEVAYLTRAMVATGRTLDLRIRPVFDFHSLGGVPGNKITPIVVSIVASQGLAIPKMSSRAVSSACGTSDFVDTFCDVELDTEGLLRSIETNKGVFACGNEDYAPVGRRIIEAERSMGIDPRPMMMASIMSKKVAIGTTHLLMDIPMGRGAKVHDMATAEAFAKDLIDLGIILGVHVECAVSYAEQPLGRTIGPILEAKECISILESGDGDPDVIDKACQMAGIILEMSGKKDGYEKAVDILKSGKAHEKFMDIVVSQNGDPNLRSADLTPGRFVKDVHAQRTGTVQFIDNSNMVAVAKGAGAPIDVGAGIELIHKVGDSVSKGDVLFRIYAENQGKLDRAIESARSRRPMRVTENQTSPADGPMVLKRIPSKEILDLIRFRNETD